MRQSISSYVEVLLKNGPTFPPGNGNAGPVCLRGGSARENMFLVQKTGPMLAPGSKLGIDPRLFPQWREDLEFLRDTEPDDPRVEREDVRGQAAIVAVQEGVGDRRLVEQVLDVELERQPAVRPLDGERHIGVVP
jgi:hypothetical protein